MMETWTAFQQVLFTIGLAAIWWLWLEYRKFTIDKTRQNLFMIRDKLFMQASRAEVPFDSEAYLLMRELLNGAIRYTERLTIIRVVRVKVALKEYDLENRFIKRFESAIKGLDEEQKQIFAHALRETDQVLIHHLSHSTLLLLLIVETATALRLTNSLMNSASSMLKDARKVMNNDIFIDSNMATA